LTQVSSKFIGKNLIETDVIKHIGTRVGKSADLADDNRHVSILRDTKIRAWEYDPNQAILWGKHGVIFWSHKPCLG
jgi:hypothetical protein